MVVVLLLSSLKVRSGGRSAQEVHDHRRKKQPGWKLNDRTGPDPVGRPETWPLGPEKEQINAYFVPTGLMPLEEAEKGLC